MRRGVSILIANSGNIGLVGTLPLCRTSNRRKPTNHNNKRSFALDSGRPADSGASFLWCKCSGCLRHNGKCSNAPARKGCLKEHEVADVHQGRVLEGDHLVMAIEAGVDLPLDGVELSEG